MVTTRRRHPLLTIASGAAGGLLLGVAARSWMRLIATDPGFSWGGTLFIVLGFTLWGTGQAIAAVVRGSTERKRPVTGARTLAVVLTLPLFMAAGGIMFPTVVGGGLARYRTNWTRWARSACVLAALLPVGFVGVQLHHDWGWSWRWFAGMAGLVAVYSAVVAGERAAMTPRLGARRVPSRVRVTLITAAALAIVVPMIGLRR